MALRPKTLTHSTKLEAGFSTLRSRRWRRAGFALLMAAYGGYLAYEPYIRDPNHHSDFSLSWFGAKAMMSGQDPYSLLGRGLQFDFAFPLLYPATAFVAAAPFAVISSEGMATSTFIALSSFLLALGATRNGWYLLPIFATDAFRTSAVAGQWTILLTAAVFFPVLALFAAAKPQASIPVFAGSQEKLTFAYGIAGSVTLIGASLIFLPGWPSTWFSLVSGSETQHMTSPILHPFGFLVLMVLSRWRRPESWMILSLASLPQTMYWYNCLILFTVPQNFRESVFLALTAGIGMLASGLLTPEFSRLADLHTWVGASVILSFYLPAVFLVLRRPSVPVRVSAAGRNRGAIEQSQPAIGGLRS